MGLTKEDQLRDLLNQKKSKLFYAKKLNISINDVEILLGKIRKKDPPAESETSFEQNIESNEIRVSKVWQHSPSPDEVIKEHKIDERKWKLSQIWIKQTSKGFLTSALFTPKKQEDFSPTDISKLITNYKSSHKPLRREDLMLNSGRDHMAFIDLTDFHLDRKELSGKTLDEKIEIFKSVLTELSTKAYHSGYIEEIVFILGSDFFNTDNFHGTTTRGTPQNSLSTWDKVYEVGFELYAWAIEHLTQFCKKLNVILIQGNHDRTKSFYLAHALSKYFERNKTINFDIETKSRKVYTYGKTFIGLHHGNTKHDDLPLTFAKEFAPLWGSCTNHEIKVGDKHFFYEKEIKGVRIKQIPALCGPDQWSDDNNYVQNIKAGIVTVYDKVYGKVSEHEVRI